MTRRLTAVGLAILLVPAAAACDSSTSSTGTRAAAAASSAASSTASVSSAPSCTPVYPDMQGTGITLANGKVTGSMTLTCTPVPTSDETFSVAIALFYRPSAAVGTTDINGPTSDTYQGTYTVTAPCKDGLWYVGEAINGEPVHGSTVHITDCGGSIN